MTQVRWVFMLCAAVLLGYTGMVWGGDELVTSVLLDQAKLQSDWQIQLPLKPAESVSRLYVYDNYLYVLTDRNFFFCIERKTGSVQSLLQIAVPGLPVTPPIHYENRSFFLTGQEIQVFEPAIGRVTNKVKLPQLNGSSGGIARNSDSFFLCGSDNRLYAFSVKDGVRLYMITADNDSPIFSVIASDKIVWFATTAGNIVAMDAWTRQKIWQYNLTGRTQVPLVPEGEYLYAAGLDAKLYKLNSETGTLVWNEPFIAGGPIRDEIVLGKTCVYVYTTVTGLHAVDKQTGKAVWNLRQGHSVLAEMGDESYVYVEPGILSVMDNSSGKEKLSLNIAGVDRYAVNTTDGVLYLADKNGRVMAAGKIPQNKISPAKP